MKKNVLLLVICMGVQMNLLPIKLYVVNCDSDTDCEKNEVCGYSFFLDPFKNVCLERECWKDEDCRKNRGQYCHTCEHGFCSKGWCK